MVKYCVSKEVRKIVIELDCVYKEVMKIVIESDSLLMAKIINKVLKVPFEITECYDDLQQALMKIEATIQHTFTEGNKMADYMANRAFESNDKQIFISFQQLPTMGKKIINVEKTQIPLLRV